MLVGWLGGCGALFGAHVDGCQEARTCGQTLACVHMRHGCVRPDAHAHAQQCMGICCPAGVWTQLGAHLVHTQMLKQENYIRRLPGKGMGREAKVVRTPLGMKAWRACIKRCIHLDSSLTRQRRCLTPSPPHHFRPGCLSHLMRGAPCLWGRLRGSEPTGRSRVVPRASMRRTKARPPPPAPALVARNTTAHAWARVYTHTHTHGHACCMCHVGACVCR